MEFSVVGAQRFSRALSAAELARLEVLSAETAGKSAGTRLAGQDGLEALVGPGSSLDRIARTALGDRVRPVRAILFDKSAENNWALGWHQDRTIAVRARAETPGFGPWSVKAGIPHVEPPFRYIENMITLRAHLDAVDADNAPLLVAPGSHLRGRVPVANIADVVAETGSVPCLADAGDVWLYATAILHASEAAKTPSSRRVLQVDFSREALPEGLEWYGV